MLLGFCFYVFELIYRVFCFFAIFTSFCIGFLQQLFIFLELDSVHRNLLESNISFILNLGRKTFDLFRKFDIKVSQLDLLLSNLLLKVIGRNNSDLLLIFSFRSWNIATLWLNIFISHIDSCARSLLVVLGSASDHSGWARSWYHYWFGLALESTFAPVRIAFRSLHMVLFS